MTYPWSSGEVLTAADLNAYAGLVLVKTQTIGSAVASVTVSDAFSATFDNYRIVVDIDSCSTSSGLLLLFGAATTGYYWTELTATTAGVVSATGGSNDSSAKIGTVRTQGGAVIIDVLQPNKALRTVFHSFGTDKATSGATPFRDGRGFMSDTTAYTSFTIDGGTATLTGGTIRVYGYNNG